MSYNLSIEKMMNIVLLSFDYNVFIESGTFTGNTTLEMCKYFNQVHTIELSEKYYNNFLQILNELQIKNIISHYGDSSNVIPQILKTFDEDKKCVFWLDGHWSSGDTAKGNKHCPLIEECCGIDDYYKSEEALILIDDYRLFGTNVNEDWIDITVENIKKCFVNFYVENEFSHDDILVLRIKRK
jgi:hypothetical protein